MTDSCLVTKLSHYIELTTSERRFLAEVEGTTTRYERRQTVAGSGDEIRDIFVVKSGWLVGLASDPDGSDFVTEICPPGDVVGVSQLGCLRSKISYQAATDVELCPFPKHEMREMYRDYPRLGALFFGFVALEHAVLIDRLRSMGRRSARDCVALFLLQMQARLKITLGDDVDNGFSIPLSQELIGNAVGLSNVSVNRALRQLEVEGHLVRDGRQMQLLHRQTLAEQVSFDALDYEFDTSWMPDAADAAA